MVAGNETLRNGIPGGMIALLQHPKSWEQLHSSPQLMPNAIREMLRWWTPVMNFRRTAKSPIVFGGQSISAGDKVMISFISANYDQSVFAAPEVFDITRQSNKHLSFGYGPHFCLGAQLAEAQMRAIFSELVERFSSIEMMSSPTFLRSNFQRGVKSLPIKFTRR
jgi:cytochrome P450